MEVGTYFEGSNDVVVVAAKHVGTLGKNALIRAGLNASAAKGVINATPICQVDAVPSMQEYYKGRPIFITKLTVPMLRMSFVA
jgi:hypothetical protein